LRGTAIGGDDIDIGEEVKRRAKAREAKSEVPRW